MARPKWTPTTDEQRQAIAAVTAAAAAATDADEALRAAIAAARALDVPVSHLADAAGRSRPRIYRHLPAPAGEDQAAP